MSGWLREVTNASNISCCIAWHRRNVPTIVENSDTERKRRERLESCTATISDKLSILSDRSSVSQRQRFVSKTRTYHNRTSSFVSVEYLIYCLSRLHTKTPYDETDATRRFAFAATAVLDARNHISMRNTRCAHALWPFAEFSLRHYCSLSS